MRTDRESRNQGLKDSRGQAVPLAPGTPGPRNPSPARLSWQFAAIIAAAQLLVFLFYVLVELQRNGKLGFPLDDPWIHLTFARNLAQGWGFAFNRGEPVQGSSAPLWTAILAFFHLFTKSAAAMVWISKILGAAFLYVAGAVRLPTGPRADPAALGRARGRGLSW